MDLIELGEMTDCEYDAEHRCAQNGYPKFDRLVHCTTSQDEPVDAWQLHGIHYAQAEEVAAGEADEIDEIIYHSMILVSFCPFCGEKLLA